MTPTSEPLPTLPDELTAPRTKLVYLTLLVAEDASSTELQELLGLSKLTLFAVLESLITSGLAYRTEDGYAVQ